MLGKVGFNSTANSRPAFGCDCPRGRALASKLVQKGASYEKALSWVKGAAPRDGQKVTIETLENPNGVAHLTHDTLMASAEEQVKNNGNKIAATLNTQA